MTSPIWHPFTQHKIFPKSIEIDRAEGAALYTKDGRRIIDGVSSWWINIHGHCHPKVIKAVQDQSAKLDQVIFAGFTHEPAEALAQKLIEITPDRLQRVFFSDSGSTAVEVALKMAIGYWAHTGRPRHKIIALDHGYHGDTFGTMAAGAPSVYNEIYDPLLFDVAHLPFPEKGQEQTTIDAFEKILTEQKDEIAALILEPLVLGGGGMKMYDPQTLKSLHDLCRQYDVLFIADEVMTGWGRTGTKFACDQAGIAPDITCLSKGLTNGFLPLAVTLCSEDIFQAFYSEDRAKTFYHSSSFTGNPIACAAAVKSLEIWDEEPVQERIDHLAAYHKKALETLSAREDVTNIRQTGTIAAFDVVSEKKGYLSNIGSTLHKFFLDNNLLLRPLGNTVYVLPPYCITEQDLGAIYDGITRALDFVRDGTEKQAA